jgi:hypothetical protein
MFGLPFSGMLVFVIVSSLALGKQRAHELLVYFAIKRKMNICVFYVLGAVFAPIGIVSLFSCVVHECSRSRWRNCELISQAFPLLAQKQSADIVTQCPSSNAMRFVAMHESGYGT